MLVRFSFVFHFLLVIFVLWISFCELIRNFFIYKSQKTFEAINFRIDNLNKTFTYTDLYGNTICRPFDYIFYKYENNFYINDIKIKSYSKEFTGVSWVDSEDNQLFIEYNIRVIVLS